MTFRRYLALGAALLATISVIVGSTGATFFRRRLPHDSDSEQIDRPTGPGPITPSGCTREAG